MSGVILTAHVRDPLKWEKNFRGHTDLFRKNDISLIDYTITKDNNIAMHSDVKDVGSYLNFLQSAEVVKAMEEDGVDRSTVKVYPLDKHLKSA